MDILICDEDRDLAGSLKTFLVGCGYTVQVSNRGSRGIQKLLSDPCGVVVLGVHVGDVEGLEMLPVIHEIDGELPVVAIGDRESMDMERTVRMAKVFYYMVLPLDFDELREVVSRAMQRQKDTGRASR